MDMPAQSMNESCNNNSNNSEQANTMKIMITRRRMPTVLLAVTMIAIIIALFIGTLFLTPSSLSSLSNNNNHHNNNNNLISERLQRRMVTPIPTIVSSTTPTPPILSTISRDGSRHLSEVVEENNVPPEASEEEYAYEAPAIPSSIAPDTNPTKPQAKEESVDDDTNEPLPNSNGPSEDPEEEEEDDDEEPIVVPPPITRKYAPIHRSLTLSAGTMDIVYTYVNRSFTRQLETFFAATTKTAEGQGISPDSVLPHMYRDRGELCFSLRSLATFMPWFAGRIHIVTNTPPKWLKFGHKSIRVVPESKIMEWDDLPTFNSMALEANLHKIPGLADHYLYFNDDFILGRAVSLADFVSPDTGCSIMYHLPVDLDGKTGRKARLRHPHGHAVLNAHRLLDSQYPIGGSGRYPRYDLAHIPHFFHKQWSTKVYETWAKELRDQSSHRFRSIHDLHFAHLYAYYLREQPTRNVVNGSCVEMRVVLPLCLPGYDYCFGIKQNATDIARELRALRERSVRLPKFLNLNDKNPTAEGARQAQRVTTHFLRTLFPHPSPYEAYDCMQHYELEPLSSDPPLEALEADTPELSRLDRMAKAKRDAELFRDLQEASKARTQELSKPKHRAPSRRLLHGHHNDNDNGNDDHINDINNGNSNNNNVNGNEMDDNNMIDMNRVISITRSLLQSSGMNDNDIDHEINDMMTAIDAVDQRPEMAHILNTLRSSQWPLPNENGHYNDIQ